MLTLTAHWQAHGDAVNAVDFDATDSIVFTAGDDCFFAAWKWDGSKYVYVLKQYLPAQVSALVWVPHRRWVVVGTDAGVIQVFRITADYTQCQEEKIVRAHTDRVTALVVDGAQDLLVSASHDKHVKVFDLRTDNLYAGSPLSAWLTSLSYDPVLQRVYTGSFDTSIYILDISQRTPTVVQTLQGHKGSVRCLAYDPRRKYLFSGSFDATLLIWDLNEERRPQIVGHLIGHESKVKAVGWHAASRLVLSGGDDAAVMAWDTREGRARDLLDCGGAPVTCMHVSATRPVAVVACKDGHVRILQLPATVEEVDAAAAAAASERDL